MTKDQVLKTLRPGDLLLYRTGMQWTAPWWSFIGWAIRVKTWSPVNHAEVYIGDRHVIAARATGSRIYPLEPDRLYEVWRPDVVVDLTAAMAWFMAHANGQRYDALGLFRFFTIGRQSVTRQFCSELATRWYRAGGFQPFAERIDADLVAPGTFRYSPRMQCIWAARG